LKSGDGGSEKNNTSIPFWRNNQSEQLAIKKRKLEPRSARESGVDLKRLKITKKEGRKTKEPTQIPLHEKKSILSSSAERKVKRRL